MASAAPRLGGGTADLDERAFGANFKMALVHEAVRAELNARRQGTHSTRTRGEVSGGNSKPWRQKGTGRARAGSTRSPLWTGGGTVFGPKPRRYTVKVNRRARRAALRSALSLHARRGSLAVFDAGVFDEPSTKRALGLLDEWLSAEQTGTTLVVLHEDESNAGLSFRNLAGVEVMAVQDAGVADVVGAATLLVSEAALGPLVQRAAGEVRRGRGRGAGSDGEAVAGSAGEASAGSADEASAGSDGEAGAGSDGEAGAGAAGEGSADAVGDAGAQGAGGQAAGGSARPSDEEEAS
ncbi:MAG TPA: 50S ribosomal protein L4 [Solirubrobacteraceae bacterium]|nr:50S ribosomal protein L4 [Solirubrobacteraceae bacterium]